jgi:hypothetical protein
MMLAAIASGALFARDLVRSPYTFLLSLVQQTLHRNLKYVERLATCNRLAVQYVLAYYKHERNGYEKRAGMIGGAIDKVGIFPALAGLVLLIWNLLKVPGAPGWATFFGPLIFSFYMLSIATSAMTQKMDEVIALLEFSVTSRK